MHWKKIKNIFSPNGTSSWMKSHAAVPFVLDITDDIVRIGFSSRNVEGKSILAALDFDMNSMEVKEIVETPLLQNGDNGLFNHDGVMPCQAFTISNEKYLYYIGWNLGVSVPFRNAIGMAKEENGVFKHLHQGPILDRNIHDPCFVASCCVIEDEGNYLMYYLSCIRWEIINDVPVHFYHIKIATSVDGFTWLPTGKIAIDFIYDNEYAISVPRVIKEDNMYKMWYSYRGGPSSETYRIGYAESENGFDWIRKDQLSGIDVSNKGWDSDMICYPFLFDHEGERYMLYNGNGYGKTGFGIAILEK
ncbi:hypothetical protein [uncultured Chryseobacterium sp.]|uniref:hypothetical protein n=1 Tax=uncultured Chryseobacterium sp. TaxID=259322 RepID=UPI0037497C7C